MRKAFLLVLLALCITPSYSQDTALLLFGGQGHETFLGCLNCVKTSELSVCNRFGNVGSKFNENSIWNRFGNFGSKFSNASPWNKFSSDAPIIVDKNGQSYGYFSANKFHNNRTRIRAFVALFNFYDRVDDLDAVREAYCE